MITPKIVILIMLVLALKQNMGAQGFVNLNFESAQVSGYSPGSSDVPTTSAMPGWNAFYSNSGGTDVANQVWYDGISLGGYIISIIDTNAPSFSPISGRYSAFLFGGGGSGGLVSASISQTGLVPVGTESLLLDAYVSGSAFTVTLGGQTIAMAPLQTFANYTLYGGNIPLNLVGQSEALTFTEPPAAVIQPSMFELDNIQFSPSIVPEPDALCLLALGGLLLAWRRRKIKGANPPTGTTTRSKISFMPPDPFSGAVAGRMPEVIEMKQVCQSRKSGAAQCSGR